jgi:hypothetical protein
MLTSQADLMNELRSKAELTKDITERLNKAIGSFLEQFIAGTAASAPKASSNGNGAHAGAAKGQQTHATAA